MVIQKLKGRSKNTEVDTALQLFITAYKEKDWSSDPHLTAIFESIINYSQKLTAAINRLKSESELEELDNIRDEKIRAFFNFIKGNIHHPNSTIKRASQALMEVLDIYTLKMVEESYPVESALVRSMLEQLREEKMEEQIGEIPGAEELLMEVTDTESAFDTAYFKVEQEKAELKLKESATEIKKDVIKVVNDSLVVYLRALVMVNENEYGKLTRTIAQVIEENNSRVKQRSAKK